MRSVVPLVVGLLFSLAFLGAQLSAAQGLPDYSSFNTSGATETPTRTPTPTPTPHPYTIYMSSERFGPEQSEFPEGTVSVYANYYVSVTVGSEAHVRISIAQNDNLSVVYSDTRNYRAPGWDYVQWTVPAGQVIPASGSPYVTNYFRLDIMSGSPVRQARWVVGSKVAFDRSAYAGTDDHAILSVRDQLANGDDLVQESVQVHVTSGADPEGFDMTLSERAIISGTFTSPGTFTSHNAGRDLAFCVTPLCAESNPASATLKVAEDDVLTVTYHTVGGLDLAATADWTMVWPTPTETSEPPGATATPSLTPTPTRPPNAVDADLTPEAGKVGHVQRVNGVSQAKFFTSTIMSGIWDQGGTVYEYVGALQFSLADLPAGAVVDQARLRLVRSGASGYEGSGSWDVELLQPTIDAAFGPTLTYTQVHTTNSLAVLTPTLHIYGAAKDQPEELVFDDAQVALLQARVATTRKVSFRIEGPIGGACEACYIKWYSGVAAAASRPRLELRFAVPQPTATPTHTPSPTGTATPTATPTPTASATPTQTDTPSPSPSSTPTASPSPSGTPTPSPTASLTPTASPSPTDTRPPSATPTSTPTRGPGMVIAGAVQNCQGARLAGVRVELMGTGHASQTDASGKYQIGPIADFLTNDYVLTASMAGFANRSLTLHLTSSGVYDDVNFAGVSCLQPLDAGPSATASSTASATGSRTSTPTSSPTATASRTATAVLPATPVASFTPTRTPSPTPTTDPTASFTPTRTPSPTPTTDPTATFTVTPGPTASPTMTATARPVLPRAYLPVVLQLVRFRILPQDIQSPSAERPRAGGVERWFETAYGMQNGR